MTAIITDKKRHPMSANHPRPFYVCRVTCPGCGLAGRMGFAGWDSIICRGCGAELQHPKRGQDD